MVSVDMKMIINIDDIEYIDAPNTEEIKQEKNDSIEILSQIVSAVGLMRTPIKVVPRTPCKEGEEEYEKAVFTGDHGFHPDKWKTPSKRKAESP
jgi:hypothetical protein